MTASNRPAKRILFLCGSPRAKGNTNTLVDWAAAAARSAGAKVEVVNVASLKSKVNGCTACFGCQKSDAFRCVIDDEIAAAIAKIPAADVTVFATPTYFFGLTAQLKGLLDRMYCLFKFEGNTMRSCVPATTEIGLVATAGGDSQSGINLVEQTFMVLANFTSHPLHTLLLPNAPLDPADLAKDAAARAKAEEFGRLLS
jgi:multimeric flavodoxin WrbA